MWKIFICIYILILINFSHLNLQEDIQKQLKNSKSHVVSLARKRRYLVFPAGSSLQLVYCMTIPMVAVGQIFTVGSTAALAWELPSTPEEIFILTGKKHLTTTTTTTTTTTEPPITTSLPVLIHDQHDHSFDYINKIDKPSKYFSDSWTYKNKYFKSPIKSYFNPFSVIKGLGFDFTPAPPENRKHYMKPSRYTQKIQASLLNSYSYPKHYQVHRRTRRNLYEKIEKFLNALHKNGKPCLLKAICEVSQVSPGKGTLVQEIIKTVFRIKPDEGYPDEDHYDGAVNKENCTEEYPSCENSVWTDMF